MSVGSCAGPGERVLAEALHNTCPRPELAAELALFGQFVGSWELECTFSEPPGRGVVLPGELRFGWVLGGRAVQDVWIVPGREHPAEGVAPGFHGSTVRFYDRGIGAWRSTWVDPVKSIVRRFVGRPVGADIELISDEERPALRWRFTDITEGSFTWTGEQATEQRPSWTPQLRMRATRLTSATGSTGSTGRSC